AGRLLLSEPAINALYAVRRRRSAIKGGRVAARVRVRCLAYALSDVVGDDVSVIGSGPAAADPSTSTDALHVIEKFGGIDAFPRAVVAHLERGAAGDLAETPKPGDASLARATTTVVGGRRDAMAGAADAAAQFGYHVVTI